MMDLFKEKAQDWDANPMIKNLSLGVSDAILNNVSMNPNMQVMDFGAGTGLISSQIISHVNKITAVDISEAMLEKLKSKPELRGKIESYCGDILEKPINKKFDLIVSAMALHHIKNTNEIVKGFAEHLNNGATVAIADLDEEDGSFHPKDIEGVFHHGFNRVHLQNIFESNGFHSVQFRTAHVIEKEQKKYSVFLVTAIKKDYENIK